LGKSAAVRALATSLDNSRNPVLYVSQSALPLLSTTPGAQCSTSPNRPSRPGTSTGISVSSSALTRAITPTTPRREVIRVLWESRADRDRPPRIVIDEVYLLSTAMLAETRLLTNFHMASASPVALCLVSQPEHRPRLRLRAFPVWPTRSSPTTPSASSTS